MASVIACPRLPDTSRCADLPCAVLHGIDVVGRPRAEDRDGDRDAEDHPEQRVGEVVDPEVDAQQGRREQHDEAEELGAHPGSAGHHEHVRDAGDHDRETTHRERGCRIALPVTDDRDVERPWPRREEQQSCSHATGERHADQEQGEVPPPLEPRHAPDGQQHQEAESPARAERIEGPGQRVEPRRAQGDHRIGDRRVEPVERRGVVVQPDASGDDDEDDQGQSEDTGSADLLGQRRWRSGRAPDASVDLGDVDDVIAVGRACRLFHTPGSPWVILARSSTTGTERPFEDPSVLARHTERAHTRRDYRFRHAYPEEIRNFAADEEMEFTACRRVRPG